MLPTRVWGIVTRVQGHCHYYIAVLRCTPGTACMVWEIASEHPLTVRMPLRGSDLHLHRRMLGLTTSVDDIAHVSRDSIALPVVDCRLYLTGTTDVFVQMQSVTHRSLERLCDCLPNSRVPFQPTRYGVSVQLEAQSW